MFRFNARPLALVALASFFTACGGGGGYSGSGINPGGTPAPSSSASAFICPSSDTVLSQRRTTSSVADATVHRPVPHGAQALSTTELVVTYASGAANAARLNGKVASLNAVTVDELPFARIGRTSRVVRVNPSNVAAVQNALRAVPGVQDVSPVRRASAFVVNGPYLTKDPYFDGYASPPPAQPPLYQTAGTGGQWDMHVEQLEHAFDYSQASNGSGVVSAGALGSTSVKLAIIDTGEDVTHPDLSGATIARTRCFLTDPDNSTTTGTFVTDGFGHGTDVTGIAAADTNNGYGFVGDAGNVSLMLYRVFPTPDDTCAQPDSQAAQNDPQCGAADVDIASAINDAVANGANVINLSLGIGEGCSSGNDPDAAEGNAVANAIAANVIVVASSGNDGSSSVSAPACDTGVIAAGASAYNDGQANGTGYTGANTEYVASYADYGSANTLHSSSSWGIVAPGGDPAGSCTTASNCDSDSLHWIENIWTTTPYQATPSDENFVGSCGASTEFGEAGDCRTLIAGTSMASPHVAGAAALVLSVNPAYQSPTAMKTLLCATADDIGDPHQGCGRLNVYRAVAVAAGDPNPPPVVP